MSKAKEPKFVRRARKDPGDLKKKDLARATQWAGSPRDPKLLLALQEERTERLLRKLQEDREEWIDLRGNDEF